MSKEVKKQCIEGWLALALHLVLIFCSLAVVISGITVENFPLILVSTLLFSLFIFSTSGFFSQEPNEARVLLLFGKYIGTCSDTGFFWTNPLHHRSKISLRSRNFDGSKLKVNDKAGNPIEISTVVVWKVKDTAQALFDVENFEHYVIVQSDSALRHLANMYGYDHGHEGEITLRSGQDQVNQDLQNELQARLGKAGVLVEEARINHLAYSPEIAGAMLKRQQAEAIIAARTKIVEGAVGMVEMALTLLEDKKIVELDVEKKASMVSNLLVILCGEKEAQPVINSGTLYS